jgi:hypothetical protein
MLSRFGVYGLGFYQRYSPGLGFRVSELPLVHIHSSEMLFRVQGSGFRVQGSGFRV